MFHVTFLDFPKISCNTVGLFRNFLWRVLIRSFYVKAFAGDRSLFSRFPVVKLGSIQNHITAQNLEVLHVG